MIARAHPVSKSSVSIPELFVMPVPLMSERVDAAGGDGVGIRRGRGKRNPIDLGIRGNRDEGGIRETRTSQYPLAHWGQSSGVQLAAVFQSPEVGLRFHWALPA